MTNQSLPKVIPYKQLFFNLEPAKLPSFETLHGLEFPTLEPNQELSKPLREKIVRELEAIHDLCRHIGFLPLVSEFALIADERIRPKEQRGFSSYISLFVPDSISIGCEYSEALKYLGSEEAGYTQIVPHAQLWQLQTGLIQLECARETDKNCSDLTSAAISDEPVHLIALREKFRMVDNPDRALSDQVMLFVNRFLDNLRNKPALSDAYSMLSRSTFVLLPFVRPHFRSAAPVKDFSRGSAGGALFLFLARSHPDASIEQLGQALAWLFAEASIRESSASFEVEHNKKELLGSMVHGTVHTIRAIGTSELSRAIAFKDPPQTRDDLRVRIFKRDRDEEDTHRGDLFVQALKAAMLGEDTAAALLALCEIQLNDGVLRTKFQNHEETSLPVLLDEALLLANAWPTTRPEYAEVELTTEQTAPVGEVDGYWVIPEHYLNAKLIRGLLGEFMRNSSFYGKRGPDGKVRMQANIRNSTENVLSVTLINEVDGVGKDVVSGSLDRTKTVLQDVNGIALEFNRTESAFRITLSLCEMNVEAQDGSTSKLNPQWRGRYPRKLK